MTSVSHKTICAICNKEKITYLCHGCSRDFCLDDLAKHLENLRQELCQIANVYDQFQGKLSDQRTDLTKHRLIEKIDQWEINSIEEIKQTAQSCREKWISYSDTFLQNIEEKSKDLAQRINQIIEENEFNDIDLKNLKEKLEGLEGELDQPPNVSIEEESTEFIDYIHLRLPFWEGKNELFSSFQKLHFSFVDHFLDTKWEESATTIAGECVQGNELNQLSSPCGIYVDEKNETIYVVDCGNDHIVEWKPNETEGRIVAAGNGRGKGTAQLNRPTNVIIDRENNALIIADRENKRVMRWFHHTSEHGEIIISDIECRGLAMHHDGSLYVSDCEKNEVRR